MRLGGPIFNKSADPESWITAVRAAGYRAAYCPVNSATDSGTIEAYVSAAKQADIVIAEVGAWSNPISADPDVRSSALALCKEQLALADRIAARCCVNIAGSRGEQWDGPHRENLAAETFDMIVESVREILDAVKPTRTYYALETMPWIFPNSPDSYLKLIRAIDRPAFAVHLDPVNMINTPARYYSNGDFIRDCFASLGPFIKTCHAKDVLMSGKLTIHIDEVRPGLGALDYGAFLHELTRLDSDTPLMIEHLPTEEEYRLAAQHIRAVARGADIEL